jgi:hypothetical protein
MWSGKHCRGHGAPSTGSASTGLDAELAVPDRHQRLPDRA